MLSKEARQLVALFEAGRYRELQEQAQRLVALHPRFGFGWKLLGVAVAIQGGDSLPMLRKAAELLPQDHETHNNLGNVLREQGRLEEAVLAFRRALELKPRYANAHFNLGTALAQLGRLEQAVLAYRRALDINPGFFEAHGQLGATLHSLARLEESVASYQRALTLNPYFAAGYAGLGKALKELGQLSESARCHRRLLELHPDSAEAHLQLGQLLDELGQPEEAMASYRRALKLRPDYLAAQSNLLFTKTCLAAQPRGALREEARLYGELLRRRAQPFVEWPNTPDPSRPLRVGLVSGDLHSHPVGYFLEGPLPALDGRRLELFAYETGGTRDALTRRLETIVPHWRSASAWDDERLAREVRADRIDILIDLSGHTSRNRLAVFARKPAPVQVSWLGYFGSTGVRGMDYILADPWTVPVGEEDQFTERVWRLPETRLCFAPPDVAAEVGPLPALGHGYVTFGCFASLAKVGETVLGTWVRVLRALDRAKLFLKTKQFADAAARERLLARFRDRGITADRLILEGPAPRAAYLAAYHRVDIALDTFPYPGGTTTIEGLWMGVPVVTLRGDRLLSRQGESILRNAGLADWIATDEDDYVSIAVARAAHHGLASLRSGLRAQLQASPLMDAARFASQFEQALRAMWQKWCAERTRAIRS